MNGTVGNHSNIKVLINGITYGYQDGIIDCEWQVSDNQNQTGITTNGIYHRNNILEYEKQVCTLTCQNASKLYNVCNDLTQRYNGQNSKATNAERAAGLFVLIEPTKYDANELVKSNAMSGFNINRSTDTPNKSSRESLDSQEEIVTKFVFTGRLQYLDRFFATA